MKKFVTIAAAAAVAVAANFYAEPAKSEPPGDLQSYCAFTQSDDCIFVDSHGYWWYSEPSLKPVYTRMKKLPKKVVGSTKIVRLENQFYCTHNSRQIKASYLACNANGWTFQQN